MRRQWARYLGWAWVVGCLAALGVASAAEPQDPAQAPAALEGNDLTVRVDIQGVGEATLSFGALGTRGFAVYPLDTEKRPGVAAVYGGTGRVGASADKGGFTVLFFLHLYEDGQSFLEGQILNDAAAKPFGNIDASYQVTFRGATIAEGSRTFYDETGVGFWAGQLRFAPRQDLLKKFVAQLPPKSRLKGIPLSDTEPVDDPDPVKNTHQSGSPRNRYVAVQGAKFVLTEDARYLARLMDFVVAQARRPYHLSEANGEPVFHAMHPEAYFLEGRPEMLAYRDTFDRLLIPSAQLKNGDGYNGWDREHMNVEELYATYVLTGSRVARRDLVLIVEQLLSTADVRDENKKPHSARTLGWMTRAFVRGYQATGNQAYLDGVRRMMNATLLHRDAEPPYRALVPQPPQGDHMKDEKWESPFMVAVATTALALYLDEDPTDSVARELLTFCGDLLVEQGYSPEHGGFYYDYSAESSKKSTGVPATKGVASWIPSALVDVARHMPEERRAKYLDPARRVYEANKKDGNALPKSIECYRWFMACARQFE
jgi:hypothetical protein